MILAVRDAGVGDVGDLQSHAGARDALRRCLGSGSQPLVKMPQLAACVPFGRDKARRDERRALRCEYGRDPDEPRSRPY